MASGSIISVDSTLEWQSTLGEIEKHGIFGLRLEAAGEGPLSHDTRIMISLPHAIFIADTTELGKEIVSDLGRLLEQKEIKKIIYDARPALAFLRASVDRKLEVCNIFDLMLASQICWSGYQYLTASHSPKNAWKKNNPNHSLASLAERHLGIILDGEGGAGSAGKEAAALLPLHQILAELIARNDLQRIADLEFRAISSLAEMEVSGIRMNLDQARNMVSQDEKEMVDLVWTMQDEARRKGFVTVSHEGRRLCYYLNPDKNEDIMAFLKRRGYPVSSTKAEVMRGLAAAGCAFAEALLRYRHVSHSLAFLNHWLERVDERDGRIHPQYFQIASSTGRISSKNPNAQAIPRTGEDAPAIRRLLTPSSGKSYVKADFSAIELRIMARLSGDKAMLEALQKGIDLHRLTASRIGGLPIEQVTDSDRKSAKIMNFLLIYGGSAKALQWRILSDYGRFIPLAEAEEAKEKFLQCYEGVREWQERQLSEISCSVVHHFHNCVQGFFELPVTATSTILGRRRIWPRFGTGITASKFQMYNTPCQGTGADLIKLVMAEVYDKISSQEARIIGSIHDEILLEVPEERAEEYAVKLKEIMERIGSELLHPVPVKAEVRVMSSLAE